MVNDYKEVNTILKNNSSNLRELGIEKVGVFGSFSRGDQTEDSDIDVIVYFAPKKKTFKSFMKTALFLEDLLKRKVDILTEQSLSPYLKPYIMKDLKYVEI